MARVRNTTYEHFDEEVIRADRPVLVDFYTDWCGPCKAIAPIIEDLAKEYEGKMDFKKVNVDANPDLAHKYGVQAVPTILFFKNGTTAETITGNASWQSLRDVINRYVA